MDIQYLPLDWHEYHELARKLSASILSHAEHIDQIVSISRGGLSLGHILSDLLQVPVATFSIQSYTDIQKHGEVIITEPLKSPIRGKHVLLADDVSDTGVTLKRGLSYLKRFKPSNITTVTMFFKPKSVFRPDFYAKETTKWILFPYEVTEMIKLITLSMDREHKPKSEIQAKLTSLGYTLEQIRYVRKYFL